VPPEHRRGERHSDSREHRLIMAALRVLYVQGLRIEQRQLIANRKQNLALEKLAAIEARLTALEPGPAVTLGLEAGPVQEQT